MAVIPNRWNPYKLWTRKHIDNLDDIIPLFKEDKPTISGGDTETTGLHIKKDHAFLIVFGWLTKDAGRVFTFYPTEHNMKRFFQMAKRTKMFVWWNTTFDLHMQKNIDPRFEYTHNNLVEGTVIARLCTEAVSANEGGDDLKLKSIGIKYVHWKAADSDKQVKEELKKLKKERVDVLAAALKQFDHPTETHVKPIRSDTGKPTTSTYAKNNPDGVEWKKLKKKWTKGLVEDFLKDIAYDVEDLPSDVREVWEEWNENYPAPTYEDIDRDLMIQYAGEDVITELEYVRKALPVIKQRNQWKTLRRETDLILPLYRMERVGIKVDRKYLEESRVRMKAYIIQQRNKLYELAGGKIKISGNSVDLPNLYRERWNIELENTQKGTLKKLIAQFDDERARIAELVKELRTLEKWYSTYIIRILDVSEYDGRFYSQVFQAGAISGRVGSDAQQFPKKAIKDEDGNEIFYPRKAFVPTDGNYDRIYYLDFSQIELRNQADWTIRVSGGDKNLCRAYMPFKCTGTHNNIIGTYNFEDPKKRKFWSLKGFWKDENENLWTPTDVHSETTHNALVLLNYNCYEKYKQYTYVGPGKPFFAEEIDEKEFKDIRNKGKIFNFMRNYGGGKGAAMEQLDLPENVAQALVDGYSQAFPEVLTYQQWIIDTHSRQGYVENMYGRRYYLSDPNRGYKLANYNVQGTCADMMKECMIACDKYLLDMQRKGYKTRMIMTIHDELQFESAKGEEFIIKKLLEIMEYHEWHLVPIVCDAEVTYTNWSEKEEVTV